MNHESHRRNDWLWTGVAFVLVLVVLPVLAALLFFARFVFLGLAVPVLVGGVALFVGNARFREWCLTLDAKEITYKGLRLAKDVAVSPVHSWARAGRDGVVVGADDLAPTVLGPVSTVELPGLGRWFRRGEPMVRLRRGDRDVVLRAPVSGLVVGRNEALHWRPELVSDSPYADGWLVRLQSERSREERSWLKRGHRARTWFRNEVDRLVSVLDSRTGFGAVVADGGALVSQLHNQIDDAAWRRLTGVFFDGRSESLDRDMSQEVAR